MLLGAYIALLIGLVLNAPGALWHPENRSFIVVVGVIGLWRYSWGMLHFLRSLWYRRVTFRHRRKLVDRLLGRREARGGRDPARGPPGRPTRCGCGRSGSSSPAFASGPRRRPPCSRQRCARRSATARRRRS